MPSATPTPASSWPPTEEPPILLPPMLRQPSPFRERMLIFLLPYFLPVTKQFEVARDTVLDTLASYGPRNRPETIHAARIIAFSFTALDVLAIVQGAETMPPQQKLRYRSCANALNRSCQQDEKAFAKRLACDIPGATKPAAEPTTDMPEAEFEAAIQQAEAHIATYRNRLSGNRPATSPQPISAAHHAQNQRRRPDIMTNVLADHGRAAQPANPI
jgi:hypothetical protein